MVVVGGGVVLVLVLVVGAVIGGCGYALPPPAQVAISTPRAYVTRVACTGASFLFSS
jgi:hypothetical protein